MTQQTLDTEGPCKCNSQTLDKDGDNWVWVCTRCGKRMPTKTTPSSFIAGEIYD